MVHLIFTASYTNEVTTLAFDPEAASLSVKSAVLVGHHPSWLTYHPDDHSLIFTGLEQSDGKAIALRFDEDGKGNVVGEAPSGGADPCTLLATKNVLYIGNYSGGTVSTLSISSEAPYFLASHTSIQMSGTGPDKSRQEGSHPHQVVINEEHGELLVPDLGADLVRRFKLGTDGSLEQRDNITFAPGGDGYLYTLLELSSELAKHKFPLYPEPPTFVKSLPSMSNPPPRPNDMLAAEVLIPAPNSTYPTPYLYLSNRNDPSSEGDIISIFAIAGPDQLELVTEVRSGLKHLRGMVFGGPDDKWLVAGGANGGGVKIFERIDGGKNLKVVAENPNVEAPTGFLWK
ncbi:hypothetical protein H0H92_005931 [Tricholoma furcatifolium]|nr:hypothetical protein H0H92_005931 [Tricholoma furcatifolium]